MARVEDESLCRLLVKHSPAAVAVLDRDMRFVGVSDRWLADYHQEGQDPIGLSYYDVFPETPERFREAYRRALDGAVERRDEEPFPGADGTSEWLEWDIRPFRDESGAIGGLIVQTRRITARKRAQAERALLLHALNERVKELTVIHQTARLLQQDRPADAAFLSDLVSLLPPAWQYPEVCEARIRYGSLEVKTPRFRDSPWRQEASFVTAHGEEGSIEVVYLEARTDEAEGPFLAEERNLISSLAELLRAHLGRKHMEQALRNEQAKFASVFWAAPVGIMISRPSDGRIIDLNRESERLLGYSRDEAIGHTTIELGLWPESKSREEYLTSLGERGAVEEFEALIRAKTGRMVPLRVSAQTIEISGAPSLVSVFIDLTARKEAEASLRKSEARFRRVFESPLLGFAFATRDGIVREANEEYLRIVGLAREELAHGRVSARQFVPPEHEGTVREPWLDVIESAGEKPFETEALRADRSRIPVLLGVSPLDETGEQSVIFILDLTERRALEHQLQQAQRMEAVGRLAAGIAHDFNNVLSAIVLGGELVRDKLRPGDPAAHQVTEILKAADRASELTRQLLAFSRQQVLRPSVLDLDDLLAELEKMLRRLLGENIELEARYARPLDFVRADPGQLQQVIVNLAINARDAMPEGGKLTIETENRLCAAPFTIGDAAMPAGSYVVLSVTDSGTGMEPETAARMFEPFFTTKKVGKGTGLGLATVYGIVRQSGGSIDVQSELGRGTRISVYLPRVDEAVEASARSPALGAVGGRETILLVEDEPAVRMVVGNVLGRLGYKVLEAADAAEAQKVAATHPEKIDALLTDLVMPGMSGRVLAMDLARSRPGLRVLLMSGYTDDPSVRHGSMPGSFGFLQKPFSMIELAQRLRGLFDQPAASE